jgi:hypothetical protein
VSTPATARPNGKSGQTIAAMTFGTIIFCATLAAWLYGETHNIDTGVVWTVTTPVIGFLFIGGALSKTADNAEQAAIQTNGSMDSKIKAAVSSALADRDMARTRQAQGDISEPVKVTLPADVVVDAARQIDPELR